MNSVNHLIKFLSEHKALNSYRYYLKKYTKMSISRYYLYRASLIPQSKSLDSKVMASLITSPFPWYKTKQGHDYWFQLESLWVDYCYRITNSH